MQLKKKILITGGNSLIGKDLVKYFLKNYFVISTFRERKIPLKHSNLKQIKFDFDKKLNLNEEIDHLIHLAASTPTNSKVNKKMLLTNKSGIIKILNNNFNFKSLILISTLSIYGKITKKILNENYKPYKINYYGKSKIQMENYLKKYAKKRSINYLILRLPAVIGNFRCKTTFMNRVFEKIYNNQDLFYENPNSFTNNIIHTETLSKIIDSFFRNNNPKNKIFNLCSGKKERLRDIIQLIYKKFNSKSKIKSTTQNNSFLISTKKLIANKIKIIDTKKTILKTIKFYKEI
ncbi:NAD(P)-dependent oxidoreductase [Candidatus Pelagibacter ubique]|nr:NAD(P)-dependent oxidoreductase [Candidatus Pelagibacter ubique]